MDMDYVVNKIMEGKPPNEISSFSLADCAVKLTCLVGATIDGLFDKKVYDDPAALFGKYMIALAKRIEKLTGIKPKLFKKFTEEDWELIRKISKEKGKQQQEGVS